MTPASRYIARLYEVAVDSQLDVTAIRRYLASNGIARSPVHVLHDLDNVYAFYGYAASHPAPVVQTMAEWDAALR